jgi:hypothetical protein
MTNAAAHSLLATVTEIATNDEMVFGYRNGTIASPIGDITLRLVPRQGYRTVGLNRRRDATTKIWEVNGKRIAYDKLIAALLAA